MVKFHKSKARALLLGATSMLAIYAAGTANAACTGTAGDDVCLVDSTTNQATPVDALGQTTFDTLQLGGAANFNFGAATVGTIYTNFELFQKVGASNVTLTGVPGVATSWDIQVGTLTASGGNAIFDTSNVDVDLGATFALTASETIGSLSGAAGSFVNLGAFTLTTGGNGGFTTFAGNMSGAGGLTKAGTGNFTLSGTNTYAGSTLVNAGSLTVSGGAAIADSGAVDVSTGAALVLSSNETIGSLSGAAGSFVSLGGNTLTTGGNNASTLFSGVISGTGGLTKEGTGNFTLFATPIDPVTFLGNPNTYSGLTLINAGTLSVSGQDAIANTGAVQIAAAGTLALLDGERIGSLSGAAGSQVNLGSFSLLTGDASNTTFAGVVSGTGGLAKLGSGEFTLSGANTYTGSTFVSEGKLILGGGSALSDLTQVTLGSGTTMQLTASETIGSLSGIGFTAPGSTPPLPPATPEICAALPAYPGCMGPPPPLPPASPGTIASIVDLGIYTLTTGGAIPAILPLETPDCNPNPPYECDFTVFAGTIIGTGGLIKAGTGGFTLSGTNTYTGLTQVNAGTLTLAGGTAIVDTGAITVASSALLALNASETIGNLTGAGGSFVNLGLNTLTTGDGSSTIFAGIISGAGGLTKQGLGTFTLSGANTYTGPTTINAGTLAVSGGSAIGDTSSVSIAAAATLDLLSSETIGALTGVSGSFATMGASSLTINNSVGPSTFAGMISGSGNLTKTGAGTQVLSGTNTYTGTTFVNAGTLSVSGGNAIIDTGAVNVGSGGTLGLASAEAIGNLTGAAGSFVALGSNTLTTGDASSTIFAGVMSGTGGLTKQGAGTFTLSGANTYTGPTTINAGTLAASGGNAIANTSNVGIASAATLDLLTSETIGSLTGAALSSVTMGANSLTINAVSGTSTFAGVISGSGNLTKTGAGTEVLSGTNTYTGTTFVNGGILQVSGSTAIADAGAVNSGIGGTFGLLASETIGSLAGTAGSFVDLGGNTLTTGDASNTNFGGAMSGGGALIKQGAGNFTLSGTNTYTGLTSVNDGTLSLAGGSAIADAGAIDLAFGGTLALLASETIGSLTGVAGSFVDLGVSTLTTGDASNTTFAGVMSGLGGLTKQGSGIFTLSGANTYTGPTTINAGTLSATGGSALANTSAVGIAAAATLDLLSSETIGSLSGAAGSFVTMGANSLTINATGGSSTFAGVISGGGTLTKTGAGTQVLGGSNSYTGTTFVNGGTLSVSGGNAIIDVGAVNVGSGATFGLLASETIGNLTGAAGSFVNLGTSTLTTGDATSTAFAGAMSGTGALTKQGLGGFTLSGVNTHTGLTSVNAGSLTLVGGAAIADAGSVTVAGGASLLLSASETIGSLFGAGAVNLGANFLTTGNGLNTSYSGAISGSGGMTKQGAGKFSTASLGYAGLTTINAGELNVNGTISGSVLINALGTLSGNSTINGSLTNLGTIQSGNSPGSTIVGGNYAGGGVLAVQVQLNNSAAPVNGTTHDYLQVGGNVSGTTLINITPVAPSNAPVATTGNGIEVVRVGGTVASNAFALAGSVVQGGYEFLLQYLPDYAGTTDGFFLQSTALQEMSVNAAMLSAGRATNSACGRDDGAHPGMDGKAYRIWADTRIGTLDASAKTGVAFEADHTCAGVGVDASVTQNFFVGISGGITETRADVSLPQGLAALEGDGGQIRVRAGYTQGPFFAVASAGYSKTYWEVYRAGGGGQEVQTKGQIGAFDAGYRIAFDKFTALTLSGSLGYDGAGCGDNCLIAGAVESVAQWSARAGMRLDTSVFGVQPFAGFSLSDNLSGGNSVAFAGATSVSDAASMVLDADAGFRADVANDVALFARGRITRGLDSDVEGYEASGGLRIVW